MIELKGKYSEAKIFTDKAEDSVITQIYDILNHPMFEGEKIRIQADTHAGKGCVIGLTTTVGKAIIPNIIGVDIGCGMLSVCLGDIEIDFKKLESFIRTNIPSGQSVNSKIQNHKLSKEDISKIEEIAKTTKSDFNRHLLSLGSLGGGNHFIEIGLDSENNKWLVIHSGSRNFGLQVAKYHQKKAIEYCQAKRKNLTFLKNRAIGLEHKKNLHIGQIEEKIRPIKKEIELYSVPKEMSFLEEEDAVKYVEDMKLAQRYASENREIMSANILKYLQVKSFNKFETIHNYYDGEIIRKGAISAKEDEIVLIPINMRDGSILAKGKGNPDYNYSAPHGAGRLMSRSKAKEKLDLVDFQNQMKNVYSESVCQSTLDEAPDAYKSMEDILSNIGETVEVLDIIKPIYNFKSN